MMNNKIGIVKKLTAGMLAAGMILTGIVVPSQQVDAEGTVTIKDTVIYDDSYNIKDYWDNGKKAPVKDGYVFGGWFKEEATTTADNKEELKAEDGSVTKICIPLAKTDIDSNGDNKVDDGVVAVAKFVPAQVLSVKAQNGVPQGGKKIESASDISEENPMWVRVMTSQDSENYDKIGFDIYLANKLQPTNNADGTKILETNKVFSKVYVGDELTEAESIFGENSHYVCVWKLDQINYSGNADKIIYVRPYWITKDGTKVNGLAKYVHIEDEYKGYISVPVNINRTKDIAAGAINMSYTEGLELATDDSGNVLLEKGRIFPDMAFNPDTTSQTIKMVGNESTVGIYDNSEETIYANIRFKMPTTNVTLNFDMSLVKFCDWGEAVLTNGTEVKVWDIEYEIEGTTN